MPFEVSTLKVRRGGFINYSYLGVDRATGASFLVDPAWERATIEEALRLSGSRCEAVLVTHAHPDHVDLADALATALGVPVLMARREIEHSGFRCRNLRPVEDGERIEFGSGHILPLLTPGHTFGSMCFLAEEHLFSGDTLFAEGCGMCVGAGSDPAALFRSLQRLKATLLPTTKVYPGHSYGQPPGQLFSRILAWNIYLQFERESDFVAYRMRRGQTSWANFV